MSELTSQSTSRREFLKSTGRIAASSALAAGIASRMYAGQSEDHVRPGNDDFV